MNILDARGDEFRNLGSNSFEFREVPGLTIPGATAAGGSPYPETPRSAPEFSVPVALKAVKDGLLLHCPACSKGKLFRTYFKMNEHCPSCGVLLAREQGAYVGAMYINILVTEAIFIIAYLILQYGLEVSTLTEILILAPLNVLFTVFFFPRSRGIWAAMLYLTGDLYRDEPDGLHSTFRH